MRSSAWASPVWLLPFSLLGSATPASAYVLNANLTPTATTAAASLPPAFLNNRVSCTSVTQPELGFTACTFPKMPLISQNHPGLSDLFPKSRGGGGGAGTPGGGGGFSFTAVSVEPSILLPPEPDPNRSMLCVPASATMALSLITDSGLTTSLKGWVSPVFKPASQTSADPNLNGRIRAFATLMETSITDGTGGRGISRYAELSPEITRAEASSNFPGDARIADPSIETSLVVNSVLNHEAGILLYGHYLEECRTTLLGRTQSCSYSRHGGHELAVNGFFKLAGESAVRFYNPWYAPIDYRAILKLPNPAPSSDGRPYGNATTFLLRAGTSVKIVDRYDSIRTR